MPESDAWPPTRWSPPLPTPDGSPWRSLVDPVLPVIELAWELGLGYRLDRWQVALIRAIFEICPAGHPNAGHLRYRQVLVSMGRQNGKSEIAAALGLIMLLLKAHALVIGIASSAEQARIVYQRAMQVILTNKGLARRFERLTDTRGLQTKAGGRYELKAAKGAALQGLPINLGIIDEVHLLAMALWTALLHGTGGRADALVAGITTAGDDDSELLKHLYELAASGVGGETFGFFIWEAPEAEVPEDDETLARYLKSANPALAESNRISLANVIADVRTMPAPDVVRYRLNRFVAAVQGYLPPALWAACKTAEMPPVPSQGVVLAVDRSPDWGYASVVAAWKDADDKTVTEVVASVTNPTLDGLVDLVARLVSRVSVRAVVVDGYGLKSLALRLKDRGVRVAIAGQPDVIAASSLLYAKVAHTKVVHGGDELLTVQLAGARRKNIGENYRVARSGSGQIDAVMATVLAVYYADTLPDHGTQLFT